MDFVGHKIEARLQESFSHGNLAAFLGRSRQNQCLKFLNIVCKQRRIFYVHRHRTNRFSVIVVEIRFSRDLL